MKMRVQRRATAGGPETVSGVDEPIVVERASGGSGAAQPAPACRATDANVPAAASAHDGVLSGESGMSTAEYAIGTVAAAAFASLLYAVVTSDAVMNALTSLVQRALSGSF